MTIDSEPMVLVGPADPMHPLSEKRPLAEHLGSKCTLQQFSDGLSFEVAVPKGGNIAGLSFQLAAIAGGEIINMWDPVDSGDLTDPYFYVQIWVPKEVA